SWFARKQSVVALSTTEAEYIAMTEATKEVLHLRGLIRDLGYSELVNEPTALYNDNQSAQALSKSEGQTARTKHIDIRYHFVKDIIREGHIKVLYMSTQEMLADVLTKALGKVKHQDCMRRLGLHNF